MYIPIRKFYNATKFKEIADSSLGKTKFEPCSPSDPKGIKLTLKDLDADQISIDPITKVKKYFSFFKLIRMIF